MEAYPAASSPSPEQNEAATPHQYEQLYSPELRREYLQLTDELIRKMVMQNTDVAIFLDKSARPVAWMVNELWDTLVPPQAETGEPIKKPEIKFLNIDREQWGAIIGRSEDEDSTINVDLMPAERMNELRQLYAPIEQNGDQSLLSNKKVLVVDEVKMSGDTLDMSQKILRKAFPDAEEITGTHWMYGSVQRDPQSGALVGQEVPIWYSDTDLRGRLVGNRDTTKSMASNSSRQRVGRYWLSAPFREPDVKGRQLRQEAKWLAEDLKNHNILYVPSAYWSDELEPIEQRIKRINDLSLEEYKERKQNELKL